MLRTDEILSTIQMLHAEHLDVRAVTLALNIEDCAASSVDHVCRKLHSKITSRANRLVEICNRVGSKYGIPVTNKRLAISPISTLLAGHGHAAAVQVAQTLDKAAAECGVDFVGGFTAAGAQASPRRRRRDELAPRCASQTVRVCASVNVASQAGINMDAIHQMGHIIQQIARATKQPGLRHCQARRVCQHPQKTTPSWPELTWERANRKRRSTSASPAPASSAALKRRIALGASYARRPGRRDQNHQLPRDPRRELIGAGGRRVNVAFGIVDLSLAPTPTVGDSIGEILEHLESPGSAAPGSTAAVALLNDAVKKGRSVCLQFRRWAQRRLYPGQRRRGLGRSRQRKHLVLEKLEAMTAVCSVGLDMIAIPGDTPAETIAAIIADEMAIGVINNKTTAARLVPVPNSKAGDVVHFGGSLAVPIIDVRNAGASDQFVHFGGRICSASVVGQLIRRKTTGKGEKNHGGTEDTEKRGRGGGGGDTKTRNTRKKRVMNRERWKKAS